MKTAIRGFGGEDAAARCDRIDYIDIGLGHRPHHQNRSSQESLLIARHATHKIWERDFIVVPQSLSVDGGPNGPSSADRILALLSLTASVLARKHERMSMRLLI